MKQHEGERIAKVMARSGVCSRRDAEKLIREGKVRVNGKIITSPALNVTKADSILINNKPLAQKDSTRVWLFHKPKGYVTSHKDEKGRDTAFSLLPKDMPRVISVGRLDLNSEGLLLLTNDGELSRFLESPKNGWRRKYRVRVYGHVTEEELAQMKEGLTVTNKRTGERVKYQPIEATIDGKSGRNTWVIFKLTEGKNREIRNVCEHFGWQVNRLIRTSFGPFNLSDLPPKGVREVSQKFLMEKLVSWPTSSKPDKGGHA
ncbi:MAG: rRNA pseudouridine synthase [Proteobacteria bacterium]|nr:rRNA pseudouridine synthase [Pseudomonadota bacterium]